MDERPLGSNRWMWAALGAFLLFIIGSTFLEGLLAPGNAIREPTVETGQVEFVPPVVRKLDEETIEIDFGQLEDDTTRFEHEGVDVDLLLRCIQEGIDREFRQREQDKVVDTMFRRMKRRPIRDTVAEMHGRCLRRLSGDAAAIP
jgi:hypothetical protein